MKQQQLIFPQGVDAKKVLVKLIGANLLEVVLEMGAYLADAEEHYQSDDIPKLEPHKVKNSSDKEVSVSANVNPNASSSSKQDLIATFYPISMEVIDSFKKSSELSEDLANSIKTAFLTKLRGLMVD